MAREIEIPKCVNCTDLRVKVDVPTIQEETIRSYAKDLSEAEMKIFLSEVKDEVLIATIHSRMIDRQYKLDAIGRHFGII